MAMRVLVTGGGGFLGSHLCDALIKAGHFVVCMDNYVTGTLENISHLHGHPLFQAMEHDVIQPIDVDVDLIFHLACPASPVQYQLDPIRTVKTTILGTMAMLDLALKQNARLLLASTSEVYGDPQVHPQPESYVGHVNPIGPRACYDEGKRCAETLCFDYFRQHRLDIKVARIFNTYGPRMQVDDGRVVSNFIVQSLRKEPLTIYGDGQQTRSFCYVDDTVQGLIALMMSNSSIQGPINIGNPAELSIAELAQQIILMTANGSTIDRLAMPQDDPVRRCPDVRLARDVLGWKASTSLEEGLAKTIDFFREQLS